MDNATAIQHTKPLRILIVDDDPVDRMAARRNVSNTGVAACIEEVDTGTGAREMMQKQRFDCVLLDYMLPDISGIDFIESLGQQAGTAPAIIVLTGEGDETIAAEALRKGAQDYLTKNTLNPRSLRRAINNAVEKVRLQAHLDLQRQQLETSNQELEQFAYVTSHDLQEPLRTITSFLQLLQKKYEGQLDDKADQYIGYAVDGAARMRAMITALLELSRIGRSEVASTRTDLDELLQQVLANLQLVIEETGAQITSDPLPQIGCRQARIMQLLQNLIANALKYRREEPPRIHISARPLPHNALDRMTYDTDVRELTIWRFCVSDNGIGIDPKFQDRVFAIFQRLHAVDEYEGTGIGLAFCKKIVESHNGRIWFKSRPGEGSRFYFTLPSRQ